MIAMASHVGRLDPSPDCQLLQLLLPSELQASCMPGSSYGVCGWLHLFMHPIFQLQGDALAVVEHDFKDVAFRSHHTPAAYREEAVLQGMRALYLDVMNAHAMLEAGTYRKHRDVAYYAAELCVSPKHLHKVSTQVSGRTPSHWIRQFTMMEIKHLMMHGKLTAKEVADKLNFDNASHFSRYVGR